MRYIGKKIDKYFTWSLLVLLSICVSWQRINMLFTNKKVCSNVIGACTLRDKNKQGVEIGERQNRCHNDIYKNILKIPSQLNFTI